MKNKKSNMATAIIFASALLMSFETQAAFVFTTDQINDANRTYFNGFEGLPDVIDYGAIYTEDNIRIEQVNGDLNGICAACWIEGSRGWYPNGGDKGYSRITLEDGAEFVSVGFLRGSGNPRNIILLYELWNNGALMQSGNVAHKEFPASYLGFSGGGFDEIRVRDGEATSSFGDDTWNALSIDSIEVTDVIIAPPRPIPTTGTLGIAILTLFMVILGVIFIKRRKQFT